MIEAFEKVGAVEIFNAVEVIRRVEAAGFAEQ